MKEKYNDLLSKLNDDNCFIATNKKNKILFDITKENNEYYANDIEASRKYMINISTFAK